MNKLKDILVAPSKESLDKNTNQDKVRYLRESIESAFEMNGCGEWAYYEDHDDNYIYFSMWDCQKSRYRQWAVSYTYEVGKVEIEDSVMEAVKLTEWKLNTIVEDNTVVTEKSLFSFLDKYFKKKEVELLKDFNDEQMISIEPIWRPAGEVDLHGDTISLEEVRKAVDNINQKIDKGTLQAGLFHGHKTNTFTWQRAWVQEVDATLGDTFVKAGTPLISAKWNNKLAWEDKKAGVLGAPSFGAKGIKLEIEDE